MCVPISSAMTLVEHKRKVPERQTVPARNTSAFMRDPAATGGAGAGAKQGGLGLAADLQRGTEAARYSWIRMTGCRACVILSFMVIRSRTFMFLFLTLLVAVHALMSSHCLWMIPRRLF
jgi:hypothetical protein